jgi:hypothetical protein
MNTSVRTSDLQRWQQCAGMCLICGQPLGLSISARERETVRKEDKEEEKNEEEIQLERLTLAEECPIRLCMMRFFMLGKREVRTVHLNTTQHNYALFLYSTYT